MFTVSKDRARPFSRKHRKYWIPVTGGMIVIGAINVGLGYCTYTPTPPPPEQIRLDEGEDPAHKMAREAAKRALDKRAAEAGDAGVPDGPVLTPAPSLK
jgi:hypothetical protein